MKTKELIKNVAIVFLSGSAIFLASQVEAFTIFSGYLLEEDGVALTETQTEIQDVIGTAMPLAMMMSLEREGTVLQIGMEGEEKQEMFSLTSQILRESLGNLEESQKITEEEFLTALVAVPSIYFQWAGDIPLDLLEKSLSGGESVGHVGSASAICLAPWGEGVGLYYLEGASYYMRPVSALELGRLSLLLESVEGKQMSFAFQRGELQGVNPLIMVSDEVKTTLTYEASTPYLQGSQVLFEQLGFQSSAAAYSTLDGMVLRQGTDSLRLSVDGLVLYQPESRGRYPLSHHGTEITLFEQVEGCRQFAKGIYQSLTVVPEIYLSSVVWEEEQLRVSFSATLDGVLLSYDDSTVVAEFVVEGDEILEFSFYYRQYVPTEEVSPVLPLAQAQAIVQNLGQGQEELLLVYQDSGGERVEATWVTS